MKYRVSFDKAKYSDNVLACIESEVDAENDIWEDVYANTRGKTKEEARLNLVDLLKLMLRAAKQPVDDRDGTN